MRGILPKFLAAIFLCILLPVFAETSPQSDDSDLWARYSTYKKALRTRHQVEGLIANACLEKPGGRVLEHHFGDSALWTGVWLATLALDYQRVPRKSTLQQIQETIRALERLEVAQGYIVRTDQGSEADTWLAKPSAGQYVGVILGLDLTFRFVERREVRERIRRLTRNIARYLQPNGYFLTDPWGRLVPRGPSGVAFEHPWRKIFHRITGRDFPAGQPDPTRFLNLNPDVSFGLLLKLKSPQERYLFSLEKAHSLYSRLQGQYSNYHLLFLSATALWGEEDPAFRDAFLDLYTKVSTDDPENPLFAVIADLILDTRRSGPVTREVLRRFPKSLPNSWDDSPFHQDNAWQRNPVQRKEPYLVPKSSGEGACEFSEYPGLDFLFPWILQDYLDRRGPGRPSGSGGR